MKKNKATDVIKSVKRVKAATLLLKKTANAIKRQHESDIQFIKQVAYILKKLERY